MTTGGSEPSAPAEMVYICPTSVAASDSGTDGTHQRRHSLNAKADGYVFYRLCTLVLGWLHGWSLDVTRQGQNQADS